MKIKLLIASLALVLVGAGCAKQSATTPSDSAGLPPTAQRGAAKGTEDAKQPAPSDDGDDHGAAGDHLAVPAGSRIALDNRNSFRSGEVTFSFKLYGLDGHAFGADDLKTTHEKKMHFLMVRDDMTGYQHLHPEYKDGKWSVSTDVPEVGDYQLYVDIEPIEEKPVVLRVPVTIGSKTAQKNFPTPNSDQSATTDGVQVSLEAEDLQTKAEVPLTFVITKNGKTVGDVGKYLGAYGHVVLLRHNDPDDFYHVHPVTESKPMDGNVEFVATFPIKGRYTLYAQFNVDGSVRTFPITVDVTKVGEADGSTH